MKINQKQHITRRGVVKRNPPKNNTTKIEREFYRIADSLVTQGSEDVLFDLVFLKDKKEMVVGWHDEEEGGDGSIFKTKKEIEEEFYRIADMSVHQGDIDVICNMIPLNVKLNFIKDYKNG